MTDTMTGAPARNYVGGEWRESAAGETYEKRNPWRPSQVTGVYPRRTPTTRARRSSAAREAFPAWSALPAGSAPRSSRRQPPRSRPAPSRSRRT